MPWSSNGNSIIAALQAQRASRDGKAEQAANQCLVLGQNAIQERCPRDTGNLANGYIRASKVTKLGEGHYLLTWTSDAPYQPYVEYRQPHLGPAIAVCMSEIIAHFKQVISE
jgi:hypothetical protein